jgi:hypothetical protein
MTIDGIDGVDPDALEESVLVVGGDAVGRSVATRIADGDIGATDQTAAPDAVVLAVDAAQSDDGGTPAFPSIPDAAVRLAVVVVPDRPTSSERSLLERLETCVDAVVLASGGGEDDLTAAVGTLVSIVQDSGMVNVDLADVETVFRPVDLAALGAGEASIDDPIAAVRDAFASLPRGVETDAASGVLVDLIGPSRMSIADIDETVSAVRSRVGPDAHVIWGGAVDPTIEDELAVRLVFAGVENARIAPGDDCPRCGRPLSSYTLEGRTRLSCEACGFADVSVRLRE